MKRKEKGKEKIKKVKKKWVKFYFFGEWIIIYPII